LWGEKIIKRHLISSLILLVLLSFLISTVLPEAPARMEKVNAYFNKADSYLISHQYDMAISYYLKGINYADDKERPKIWDDLGYAFLKKRELEKAKAYLKVARSVRPENFNVYLYLAVVYILNNEIDIASAELKKIEENIYFDDSWIKLISDSELRREDGKKISKHEAERLIKEKGIYVQKTTQEKTLVPSVTIQIDAFNERNEGTFYFGQGIILKRREEFEKAEKKLLAALDAYYDEKEVRFQLWDLYLKTNQPVKAEEQMDVLKKLDFTFRETHEVKFRFHHRLKNHTNNLLQDLHERFLKELERGKIHQSINTLEKAFDIDEQSFVINHNLALLYFDIYELEKAEMYCARALWFKEDHLGSHDLMGNIYFHKRAYERALNEYKSILEIDEWNAHAHYNLGSVYHSLKDWFHAEQHWKKAIECEKRKEKIREEESSQEKGLKYSLTVRKRPISFLSHESLGKMYSDQRLVTKAIVEFENAIKLKPNESEPYLYLAKSYYKKGEEKKAVSCLEKYLYLGGKREKEARKLLDQIKKREERKPVG